MSGQLLDLMGEAAKRPLYLVDAPTLTERDRRSAIATWQGRMVNEWVSARIFKDLQLQAADAGLSSAWRDKLARFEADEYRHGTQCAAAVVALGGEARQTLPDLPPVPTHGDTCALEGLMRNVLSVSCLSETVAVALINSERLESGPRELERTLRLILADEVGHARFGWRLLDELAPKLGPVRKKRLSAWLRLAFGHLEAHELRELPAGPAPSQQAAEVGVCDGNEARSLFYETVSTVIVPGLERRGLAAQAAWQSRVAA
ncbi:MAG: ferritin-like domain-containing protein [Myxococcales bacterium]|nr:ferritin-like domain-containing protein [Myxococcales bacterium]